MNHAPTGTTAVATGPLALQTLVGHLLDHRLPPPVSIDMPTTETPHLVVYLASPDATRWLDSEGFTVADEQVYPTRAIGELAGRYETVHLTATLPSPVGDVRLSFRYLRRALQAVPAEVGA